MSLRSRTVEWKAPRLEHVLSVGHKHAYPVHPAHSRSKSGNLMIRWGDANLERRVTGWFEYLKRAQALGDGQKRAKAEAVAAEKFTQMYRELSASRNAILGHMKVGHFSHITWTLVYDMLTAKNGLIQERSAANIAVAEVARFVKEVVDEYTAAAM